MQWPNHTKLREKAWRLQQASRAFLASCRHLGARVWPFAKNHTLAPPRLEAGDWAGRLNEEKNFLLSLLAGMETEFLSTGAGLLRLAKQLNEGQQKCQSLTGLTLGQAQDAAIQFAFQLLKKAEDLVLASYDQYDHVFATFSELQRRLSKLPKQHDELMRVLWPLNFITTSFRIEASRQPPEVREVFVTLAADVNRMLNEVRGALERQFEDLAAYEQMARSLMEAVSASIQQQRKEVAATLATSRDHLRALNRALTASGAGASDLAHLNEAVTRHIGGIVMAQQCQDITRQRIEHVGEAMDEIGAHLVEGQQTTSASNSNTRQFVFRAGQIQLQQVQNVFEELNRAADSLKSGIQSLRREAGAAAELAVKVGGTTLDARVGSQCQASLGDILGIVAQAVQKIADILATFEPLQARFVNCTSKATELARDLRHAALNAQIFAVHAPAGATLEVLAGGLYLISDEAIRQVNLLGGAHRHMAEMVNNLRQRLADFQHLGQAEQDVLIDESALSLKKLADLEGAIPVLIRGITHQQGTFAQSVEEVLANVQFPVAVAEASSRSIGFFQDLVAWGGESGFVVESAAAQKIDLLKSNYTMESERHAHTAALQPVLAPANATVSQRSIELFDELESRLPTTAGSLCEIAPSSKRSEAQPRPADLSASEITPPTQAHPLGSDNPAASEGLGDNVELF